MRRIAPALVLSVFLVAACSRDQSNDTESAEQVTARYVEARSALGAELRGLRAEFRGLLLPKAPGLAFSPLVEASERERVLEVTSRWGTVLRALPRERLPADHAIELSSVLEALDQLATSRGGSTQDARNAARFVALDVGLSAVEARYDELDAQTAASNWHLFAGSLADRMARIGAQASGRSQGDAQFMTCLLADAIEGGSSLTMVVAATVSTEFDERVERLRQGAPNLGRCIELGGAESNHAGGTVRRSAEAHAARERRASVLIEQFSGSLKSLDLPPANLVPLDQVVSNDPIFTAQDSQGALDLIEDAANRSDRWLQPLLSAVLGESVEVRLESGRTGLGVVGADALYIAPSPGRRNSGLLIVDKQRLAERKAWEAAAVIVDALIADCFRQPLIQMNCAQRRADRAAAFFADGRHPGDPRLAIGVLIRMRGYVLGPRAPAEPEEHRRDLKGPTAHGLGVLVSAADLEALADALAAKPALGL